MPEQLAFDQLLGDGRAIHFDERSVTPIATQMQEMRDELFAGSVLTVNQHPPICGRGELDLLAQCLHGDRVADHHVFLIDLLPQEPVFFLESPLMQGVFYNQQRLLEREGFFDEIKSPQFRGPHGGLNRSMARNHYDGGQGRNLPNLLQHLQAVHARKPDIEQDDGKVPAREERQALLPLLIVQLGPAAGARSRWSAPLDERPCGVAGSRWYREKFCGLLQFLPHGRRGG